MRIIQNSFLTLLLLLSFLFLIPHFNTTQAANFSMQSGYYIGTGSSQAITGIGFQPQFVFIKSDTAAGSGAYKTSSMPAANMALITATADDTTSQLVLNSNGFTLGTNANVNSQNVRYTWVAFAGSDCSASGTFCVGQFTGNGTSPRTISTGFQPSFVMLKRTTAVAAHFHTASQPNNETLYFQNTVRDTTGSFLQSFTASGFTVGATDNTNAAVYNYIAFKTTAGIFAEGTYAGNATDNRTITSLGFQPDMVIVKNATNATANNTRSVLNQEESYGDNATPLTATANAVNYIQALQSDGFQVGTNVFVNGTGDTYYWIAFAGSPAYSTSGSFELDVGTYTGNGTSQTISGLPFAPDLVIIKDNGTNYGVFRSDVMFGDTTAYLANAAANFTGGITSLGSSSFAVGSNAAVNTNGTVYHWQAFGGAFNPYTNTGTNDFAIGAFTGNGLDTRDITRLPWQPDLVAIKRSGASAGAWRSSALAGDLTTFFGATAETANYIQALQADGFEVGTNAAVNTAAALNYWFAFKNGTNFTTNTYTGNATDNRDITGIGFQPDLVWIKRSTAVNGVTRGSSLGGDATQYFANAANVADRIQSFIADGFQIGGNQTETNTNAATYRYAVWRQPFVPVVSVTVTTDGSIAYGTLNSGDSKSTIQLSDTQTVQNNGNVAEDFSIKTDAPAGWTLGATPASDVFVHEFSTNAGSNWTKFVAADVYQSLVSNIAVDSSQNFDTRFTAPNPSTSTSQKTITLTIQAVQH